MKKPASGDRADASEVADSPDFHALTPPEDLVRGERTRDDFLDAVLQLDVPATVEEVASLADHGTDAAREYLDWFERMGIVERVTDAPATYRRNREYLTWRRIQRLRSEYETEELVETLESESQRDRDFAEAFGVESPAAVAISEYAAANDRSVEDVWETLSEWKTVRRRIELLERALGPTDDGSPGYRRSVA